MFGKLKVLALTGALAASSFGASGAQAAGWIIGLVDGKSIVIIDPATRKVTSKVDVKGAGPLLGIDVRPADGMLYGVASDGTIVTIDPKSGQATMKSKMSETLKPGLSGTVDFNPVADRLRVMGSDGTSLRVNVDDGKATVLYNIDAATGLLVTQAPPNDGVLNTVGSLGMTVSGPVAFNIVSTGEDKNDGWLVAGGALYSVDLKTGKAAMVGKIEGLSGNLVDIAWID